MLLVNSAINLLFKVGIFVLLTYEIRIYPPSSSTTSVSQNTVLAYDLSVIIQQSALHIYYILVIWFLRGLVMKVLHYVLKHGVHFGYITQITLAEECVVFLHRPSI